MYLHVDIGCEEGHGGEVDSIPKLSAATTTPSLNLTPNTDVPVTAGDCVCVIGAPAAVFEF